MPNAKTKLDRSRSFGTVYGGGSVRYEQDNRQFDHQGHQILPDAQRDDLSNGADSASTAGSAAAERMRRTRERRKRGVVAVVPLEVTTEDISKFVTRNLLPKEKADDRLVIAAAVRKVLDQWKAGRAHDAGAYVRENPADVAFG